jgi:hypothetical protein
MKAINFLQYVGKYYGYGVVFSALYCFLSGWNTTAFITFIFVGPLMLIGLFFILGNLKVVSFNSEFKITDVNISRIFKKSYLTSPLFFWLYLLFMLLPFLSYRISYYCIEKRYAVDMWWLYNNRYLTLAYATYAVLLILGLIALGIFIKKLLRKIRLKRKATEK